ncbi:DUF1847 domain-containing protein [candidate division KSB3 bacterium]|uniref:DUF1847 domain-containing protein n=1 Tax=candidate division KSB3 bacterium TaxID=2044937 RepID=A0A9D5JS23_9BACT|nr:DUF1847 domain-containing protein [candidate division KSB3 bacterium]MBD3323214.1 DUF1847 domain-containing protein [candidate division KSB3 bacterium]
MKHPQTARCAVCRIPSDDRVCTHETGKGDKGCPTLAKADLIDATREEYRKPEVAEFARQASIQEAECYAHRDRRPFVMHPTKSRMQEIYEFAHKMGYTRLGLAFCAGLVKEAEIVAHILEFQGFEVVSAICKVGSIPKETIGLTDEERIRIGEYEAMCNPIMQAKVLNDANTDFNIMVGLCVGHDSLFFKYADAPCTVLAAKDRVSGHNPLGAIYTAHSYYERLSKP